MAYPGERLPLVPAWWCPAYLSATDQEQIWKEVNALPFQMCHARNQKLARETVVLATRDLASLPAYWGDGVHVCPFGPQAEALRLRLRRDCQMDFDVCLLNRYRNGKQTIAWHADKEEQGITRCIASISLGAERTFEFLAHDSGERTSLQLCAGSLLTMVDPCQETHLHRVPAHTCADVRINLTFRLFH